jgi:hypothetical protein
MAKISNCRKKKVLVINNNRSGARIAWIYFPSFLRSQWKILRGYADTHTHICEREGFIVTSIIIIIVVAAAQN